MLNRINLSWIFLCPALTATLAYTAQAQNVRADLGVIGERSGVTLNVDLTYNNKRLFAIGRIFGGEDTEETRKGPGLSNSTFLAEAAAGVLLRKGRNVVGPLVGFDTQKRIVAGSMLATGVLGHSISYLGYAKLSSESDRDHETRHRLLVDLKTDNKLFLRWDWKTAGRSQRHSRLGIELHTRFNKMNLPLYVEPFWNFVGRQVGIRAGTRL